ncbi:TPA: 4Fe-4S binding protein [Candidatus Micrarchaeota archaeon]|nr:MAG: hypothetical protein AUJ65_01945 [Candidatus Micrarchaeota archaeon CG1_02_51_15]HII39251.1 4Fe-4S binding protein [Candidatus Micrarchaeota archaeon]
MDLVIKPGARNKTGSWRTMRPIVDAAKCTRCGICETFCPDSCITITPDGAQMDYDYCKGCLICLRECPFKAISAQKEEK